MPCGQADACRRTLLSPTCSAASLSAAFRAPRQPGRRASCMSPSAEKRLSTPSAGKDPAQTAGHFRSSSAPMAASGNARRTRQALPPASCAASRAARGRRTRTRVSAGPALRALRVLRRLAPRGRRRGRVPATEAARARGRRRTGLGRRAGGRAERHGQPVRPQEAEPRHGAGQGRAGEAGPAGVGGVGGAARSPARRGRLPPCPPPGPGRARRSARGPAPGSRPRARGPRSARPAGSGPDVVTLPPAARPAGPVESQEADFGFGGRAGGAPLCGVALCPPASPRARGGESWAPAAPRARASRPEVGSGVRGPRLRPRVWRTPGAAVGCGGRAARPSLCSQNWGLRGNETSPRTTVECDERSRRLGIPWSPRSPAASRSVPEAPRQRAGLGGAACLPAPQNAVSGASPDAGTLSTRTMVLLVESGAPSRAAGT